MKTYKLVAEGHSGVIDVEEQHLCSVEANSRQEALDKLNDMYTHVRWIPEWNCFRYGNRRINVMCEDDIRFMAFILWEQSGKPEGRSDEFWNKAENIIQNGA